jgi:hypothetical protein
MLKGSSSSRTRIAGIVSISCKEEEVGRGRQRRQIKGGSYEIGPKGIDGDVEDKESIWLGQPRYQGKEIS